MSSQMANLAQTAAQWHQTCPPKDRIIVRQHVLRKLCSFFPGESLLTIQEKTLAFEEKAFQDSRERYDYLHRVADALTGVENLVNLAQQSIGHSSYAQNEVADTVNVEPSTGYAAGSAVPWQQSCPLWNRIKVCQHMLRNLMHFFPSVPDITNSRLTLELEAEAFRGSRDWNDYLWRMANVLTRVQNAAVIATDNPMPSRVITCNICCCDKRISSSKVTKNCSHDREVCSDCLQSHIKAEVARKGRSNVVCIAGDCNALFDYNEIRQYADARTFALYDTALLRQAVEKDPEFCRCSACGAGQLHVDRANVPIMICHACGSKTCVTHRSAWHYGRTCAEYDKEEKATDEVGLLKLLRRRNVKQCPACGTAIEKNGGCNHMTCKKQSGGCGAEFCWVCLAFYTGRGGIRAIGNKAHRRSCRFYR